jgi:iron complex outermembrane recepter protein
LFRRDVDGFIADASVEFEDPEFGRLRFVAPDNGGEGRLQGVELGFTGFLDFESVPEWARGFGIQANYTYIDNGAELPPRLVTLDTDGDGPQAPINLFPGKVPIEDVSEHSYNLVGLYENEIFSARLAYNYRGKFTDFYQRFFDPGIGRDRVAPIIQEGRGVLDFSASVTPIENVTIAFDATNLTGDPIKTFREYNGEGGIFSRQRRYLERTYALTLRVRY